MQIATDVLVTLALIAHFAHVPTVCDLFAYAAAMLATGSLLFLVGAIAYSQWRSYVKQ